MRRQLALPLALLFIALGVSSNAQNAGDEARVAVDEGAPLTVECALRVEERAEWRLDGGAVPADLRPAGELTAGSRLTARLHAPAARPQHAGAYTCAREPAQRVLVRVRPKPLRQAPAEGPAPATAPSSALPAAPEPALPVVLYDVGRTFALNCSVAAAPGAAVVWKKNDTAVESLWDLRGRYTLDKESTVFKMSSRTTEDDFGNYTCSLGDNSETWEVRGRPHAKLQHNTNVVEKQNLKLTCKLTGKPYPAVTWLFKNDTTENGTDVAAALGARVSLQTSAQGVAGAELLLKDAERSDAGEYTCVPEGGLSAATTLRVKDQYAALWPFLGICAEVFVLCAIILVYEKRRTKPELDDSDTDNHDQKKS